MLQITKQGNSIVVKGLDHALYPYSGTLEIPCNSVITVVDEGDIVTFRAASNYDVLFSGLVSEITINGEAVTKENVGDKFGAISNTSGGGGEGGLTPEQEERLNNAVQIADYNADKEAQATIDESQNAAIEGLSGDIEGKQDKIDDLDAIREGAEKGATALQEETDPVWNAEKGNYYTKGETDGLVNEAKTAASSAMSVAASAEGIASAAHSMADEALEELKNKADKGEIPSLDGYATEEYVNGEVAKKQDVIADLDAIRDGAAKGATAIQEHQSLDGYATEEWVEGKGYLTEHQDISGKLDKTEAAETYQPKGNYATKDEIPSLDGYATEEWVEGKGYLTEHQDISGKQDVITDLGEIREGAALGKTALQSFSETDPVWTAEKGNYYTKDEADGKFLTEHQDISGKLDKTEAEETYQPKGDYALKNDLEGYVGVETYNQHITDQSAIDEAQNSAIEGIEGDISRIDSKIDDIELFKFPNATIIGEPTIQSGQVSNFSTDNYLQFPFVLDLHNQAFQIDFCFTTSTDVSGQQNVLDSKFGLALAVKDGKGLMAISSNGTSWNIGSVIGTMNIEPNTTYYARFTWDGIQYKTFLSTDGAEYTQDMVLVGAQRPFPTNIYIGGCDLSATGHESHPFKGTINMNKAQLTVMGNVVWQGMDDAGLATRLATNLNNIDEVGKERIKEIVGTIPTKTSELTNDSGFLTEHQSLAEYAKTADVEANYQPKGDYLTEETDPVWNAEKGNYYDKEEIEGMFAQADATYQPKGNYATKDEIPSLDGYATEEWVEGKGYLTEHQSLEGYAKTADVNAELEKKQDVITDLDEIRDGAAKGATAIQEHQDISGKQDVITDLADIREGAALGKTALQSFTETDPTVPAHVKAITEEDIAKWNQGGHDVYQWSFYPYSYATENVSFTFEKNGRQITSSEGYKVKYKRYSKTGSIDYIYKTASTTSFVFDIPLSDDTIFIVGYLQEGEYRRLDFSFDVVSNIKGGGGEPDEYIKNAVTSEDGKTLTLSKKDGSEVVFSQNLDGYATEEWVEGKGYLTEHQPLKTINGETIVGDGDITVKGRDVWSIQPYSYSSPVSKGAYVYVSKNGYWAGSSGYEVYAAYYQPNGSSGKLKAYLNGSRHVIDNIPSDTMYLYVWVSNPNFSDGCLASCTILFRESIQKRLTSGTDIKTINGESILGSGNIEIQGGGGDETDPIWTAEKVNYYTKTEVDEMIGNINNALAKLING